jgi:hypothetical protein
LSSTGSWFWIGIGEVSKRTGLDVEALLFASYLLSTFGIYAMIFGLGREACGSERAGWLAVSLALLSSDFHVASLLAYDIIPRDHADQTMLAWPLLLGSLLVRLRERRGWSYLLSGLAFNFNPFFAADIAGCFFVMDALEESGARRVIAPAGGAAVFAAAALPGLAMISRLPRASLWDRGWAAVLRSWYPYHWFPSSWPAQQWLYIALHGGALAALFAAAFRRRRPELFRLGAVLASAWIVYGAFSELAPFRGIVLTQFLRLDTLATLLGLLGAAAVIDRFLSSGLEGAAWAGLTWVCVANPHRTLLPLGLLLPAALAWSVQDLKRIRLSASSWAAALAAAVGVARLAFGFRLSVLFPVESAALAALFALLALKPALPRRGINAALGAAAILLFAECGYSQALARKARAADRHQLERDAIGDWLRCRTPTDSLVLMPPIFMDLRLASKRAQVAEILDGAATAWAPDFGLEWKRRMDAIGYPVDEGPEGGQGEPSRFFPLLRQNGGGRPRFRPWDEARQRRLISEFKPDYVVMPFKPIEGLRPVFAAGSITVYKVVR